MATRFRLTNDTTAPDVSPALQSYSHNAPSTVRRKLLTTDASTLTQFTYTPDGADHLVAGDALLAQFVSDPMESGIAFNNGDAISISAQWLEAHAGNNLQAQIWVGIYSEDGTTLRRELRAKLLEGSEMGTARASEHISTTQGGANYTTVTGDRLVLEISASGTPTGAGGVQGHNASVWLGGSGSVDLDAADGDTGTTDNPWFDVAPTVTFVQPEAPIETLAAQLQYGGEPVWADDESEWWTRAPSGYRGVIFGTDEDTLAAAGRYTLFNDWFWAEAETEDYQPEVDVTSALFPPAAPSEPDETFAAQPEFQAWHWPPDEIEDHQAPEVDITAALFPPVVVEPIETFAAQPLAEQAWFADVELEDYLAPPEQLEFLAPPEVGTTGLIASQPHYGEAFWPEQETEDYQHDATIDLTWFHFPTALEAIEVFAGQPPYSEWLWQDESDTWTTDAPLGVEVLTPAVVGGAVPVKGPTTKRPISSRNESVLIGASANRFALVGAGHDEVQVVETANRPNVTGSGHNETEEV